jgi:prepilin-type N-terminal cleavage/methylation domain-containing protein
MKGDTGFSLVELLLASAIGLMLVAAALVLTNQAEGTFQAQPEAADMQQRLRVAIDSVVKDLMMAGAGMDSGAAAGPLNRFFAPVLPYRVGARQAGAPGSVETQTISVIFVPQGAPQTTIMDPLVGAAADVRVKLGAGCPAGDTLCGFREGMGVLVFDDSGAHDVFTVAAAMGQTLSLELRGPQLSRIYRAGAYIAQVSVDSYGLKGDPQSDASQLTHYDGYRSDMPVIDQVVDLGFEYYGEPGPPAIIRPLSEPDGPWTTYGPKPPEVGVDDPLDGWTAGENCVFALSGGSHVPRLADLDPGAEGLIRLDPAALRDGPWCPDAGVPGRFDADLLRIRKIVVTVRVQVASGALRGPAGVLFARGGISRGGERFVPDQEIRFDVAPRNLNLGR